MIRWLMLGTLLWLVGCQEEQTAEELLVEDLLEIEQYVAANGLAGQFTEDGLYYDISDVLNTSVSLPFDLDEESISGELTGTGEQPTISDSILVRYEGTFLSGEVFNKADDSGYLLLGELIEGWQIGIQLMSVGSSATLIIPSSLAYGDAGLTRGDVMIPPNAILRYDITLLNIK